MAQILCAARAQTHNSGADASAWALIHDTSDAQILDRFIAAYPASPLAALAQARKRELSARASTGHAVQSNPPAATGETFMDGGRKGVAATPGTTILRVRPAKPAQEALRLSPERLSNWNNQLSSGGSNSYSGYFPAPRVVGVKPVPGNALPAAFNGNINLTLFRL